jgi:hypothetical protein
MKAVAPCTSYAPGRALPINECERCGHMRHEHKVEHRSLPTGHQGVPPDVTPGPAIPRVEENPDILYCRACSAGLIIKPPHNPDTWMCPQCGHTGPKSKHPIKVMADEKAQQAAPSIVKELPPELAAIAKAHDEVRAELASPEMQVAEQQVADSILADKVAEILMPWKKDEPSEESDTITDIAAAPPEGETNATGRQRETKT